MGRAVLVLLLLASSDLFARRATRRQPTPLELGKTSYEAGHYRNSLRYFLEAARKGDSSTRHLASYYQGLALSELRLYYSSYLAFRGLLSTADRANMAVYAKAIKNAVLIADKLNLTESVGKTLYLLPQGFISPSVAGYASYAIGSYLITTGDDGKAARFLKSVPSSNPLFAKSVFLLGVIATRAKDYKTAVNYFNEAVNACGTEKSKSALKELSRLNLARSTYSAGRVEQSIEIYSQFTSSSPHWLTILLEASWPLLRVNDTTVSLGNLHTVLSPFYQEDLVGEGYVLRATILYSLCKYEEMRRTLDRFFAIYDPILQAMQSEMHRLTSDRAFYEAFENEKGLNPAFIHFAKRDGGVAKSLEVLEILKREKVYLARLGSSGSSSWMKQLDEVIRSMEQELGGDLRRMHSRKQKELAAQREQANYLKVEIVTGEKELIEGQKGLPPKRVVDVETSVGENYHFWPYAGEYWEDELGAYVYTTESSCVN